jgi:hypothetical protein
MKLTIGRIVHYKLTNGDAREIAARREQDAIVANTAHVGQVLPAMVVAVFSEGYANIQVFLDGPDQHWCTSRKEGTEEGQWQWPTRETEDTTGKHAATEHPLQAEVLDA